MKSLTNNGDKGGDVAAGNTPHLVHGVRVGPSGEALGGGGGGDSTVSSEDENLGRMLHSWSTAVILKGEGAEHMQIKGPHEQVLRWGGGHLITFPSLSVAAILCTAQAVS